MTRKSEGLLDGRVGPRRRKAKRWWRFPVRGRIGKDTTALVGGVLMIDRKTGVVAVRAYRSRTVWMLTLDAVAEVVVAKAAKAAAEERLGTRGP